MRYFIFALMFIVLSPVLAVAGNVKYLEPKGSSKPIIYYFGHVDEGDGKKILKLVKDKKARTIVLFSAGGSFIESMIINEIVREFDMETVVLKDMFCMSACAFIWMGGKKRVMQKGAVINFHRPYIKDGSIPDGVKHNLAWFIGRNGYSWTMYEDLFKTDKESYITLTPQVAAKWGMTYWEAQ